MFSMLQENLIPEIQTQALDKEIDSEYCLHLTQKQEILHRRISLDWIANLHHFWY